MVDVGCRSDDPFLSLTFIHCSFMLCQSESIDDADGKDDDDVSYTTFFTLYFYSDFYRRQIENKTGKVQLHNGSAKSQNINGLDRQLKPIRYSSFVAKIVEIFISLLNGTEPFDPFKGAFLNDSIWQFPVCPDGQIFIQF